MPESRRKWMIAVYLAGGENVSREMIVSLHDLRDAALENRDSLSVFAQFDPDSRAPRLFAFDRATRAALEARHGSPARSRAPMPLGLANYEFALLDARGAASRLTAFVETARATSLDGALMLVVSGHANGAVGEFLGHRNASDPLFLGDLGAAVASGSSDRPKIDVVGLDCCNMSMVEVAYEIAPHARFMVASEGEILNHGWPYRVMLDALGGLEPEEAAVEAARQYAGNYSDYGLLDVPAHCAVCRLEEIEPLASRIAELGRVLLDSIEDPDVWRPTVLAHWEAQSYKDEEYVDLADFCDRLRMHAGEPAIRGAASAVIEAVERAVVLSCASGSAFQYSSGLSIYFPWCHDAAKRAAKDGRSDLDRYRELAFSRRTGWAEFLDAYLVATRRPPRSNLGAEWPSAAALRVESFSTQFWEEANATSEKENEMAFKRVPPWSSKGQASRPASWKNHPTETVAEGSLPTRRVPPWSSKGSGGRSTVKNHPRSS